MFSDRAQIYGILWIWVVEAKPRFCRAMEKRRTSLKVGLGGFLGPPNHGKCYVRKKIPRPAVVKNRKKKQCFLVLHSAFLIAAKVLQVLLICVRNRKRSLGCHDKKRPHKGVIASMSPCRTPNNFAFVTPFRAAEIVKVLARLSE